VSPVLASPVHIISNLPVGVDRSTLSTPKIFEIQNMVQLRSKTRRLDLGRSQTFVCSEHLTLPFSRRVIVAELSYRNNVQDLEWILTMKTYKTHQKLQLEKVVSCRGD
jgi:hypothetical protein